MARVCSVSSHAKHAFSKKSLECIELVQDHGVLGDAHYGRTVKHRSRVKQDPDQQNLRQVHLIHAELFAELSSKGFVVRPGDMGENITTEGIDLLALPRHTMLRVGTAQIEVTGLRNPCQQLNAFQDGLMSAVLDRDNEGNLVRKAGIMGIVRQSGLVHINNPIKVFYPDRPFYQL